MFSKSGLPIAPLAPESKSYGFIIWKYTFPFAIFKNLTILPFSVLIFSLKKCSNWSLISWTYELSSWTAFNIPVVPSANAPKLVTILWLPFINVFGASHTTIHASCNNTCSASLNDVVKLLAPLLWLPVLSSISKLNIIVAPAFS